MHADTDNEENIFWQKLSHGILERHRRYAMVTNHLRTPYTVYFNKKHTILRRPTEKIER